MRASLLLTLAVIPAMVLGQDAPRRKTGLWELKMSGGQMPRPMTMQQCVDEKTDDMSRPQGPGRQDCSKPTVRRDGGSTTVDAECRVEGSTAKTHAVFTGDMQSAYRGDITTTFTPPLHGMSEQKMSMEGRWIGPCTASPQAAPGRMDPESARRMAEELRKQYGK